MRDSLVAFFSTHEAEIAVKGMPSAETWSFEVASYVSYEIWEIGPPQGFGRDVQSRVRVAISAQTLVMSGHN